MSAAAEVVIPRKIWTREEVERLSLDGLSLELVNGELIDRMGKKPPHVYWKSVLLEWLRGQFGFEYVRSEDPIDVAPQDNPTSEPEPDLSVTFRSIQETLGANPTPDELRLVVEISDRTYDYDRKIKAALYARAGIREYWVVDIRVPAAPRLLQHLEPGNGRYQSLVTYSVDDEIQVLEGIHLSLKRLMSTKLSSHSK